MSNLFSLNDIIISLPQIILVTGAILMLIVQVVLPLARKSVAFLLALLTILAALYVTFFGYNDGMHFALPSLYAKSVTALGFQENLRFNSYIQQYAFAILSAMLLLILFMPRVLRERGLELAEVYQFLLYTGAGLLFMISANDLMTFFIGLELSSLPLFIFAAWNRKDAASSEAGIKYYVLSALSLAFMLLGVALIYGGAGTTRMLEVFAHTQNLNYAEEPFRFILTLSGWFFILSGLLYKAAIVPFHAWSIDVYDGSPTMFTAVMGALVKIGMLGSAFRILEFVPPEMRAIINPAVVIFSIASMIYGNFAALRQNNLKRMFAYSSIAHSGYMVALLVFFPDTYKSVLLKADASSALFYYLITYALATILVFVTIAYMENDSEDGRVITFDSIKGLSKKNPVAAFMLSVSALSFAGIPPLAGFFAKLFVLRVLVTAEYYYLAVMLIITSIIGIYYYVRVLFYVYWDFDKESTTVGVQSPYRGISAWTSAMFTVAGVLLLGFVSESIFNLARTASQQIQ